MRIWTSSLGYMGAVVVATAITLRPACLMAAEEILVSFDCYSSNPCNEVPTNNSAAPGVVQGSDGLLYGLTIGGGPAGLGTIFSSTLDGTLGVVYSWDGSASTNPKIWAPREALIKGSDGNFYGSANDGSGNTTFFRVSPGGGVAGFGLMPASGAVAGRLLQAADGNFYGTTTAQQDGQGNRTNCGSVFKLTPAGQVTTLHTFACQTAVCSSNADAPGGGLIQGGDGDLYGVTQSGGDDACGSVYKITTAGAFTQLHSFDPLEQDGEAPRGSLVQGADGNLFGTTSRGGLGGGGTIFKITSSGALTTLASFAEYDGRNPNGSLLQAADGNFYGTTEGRDAYLSGDGSVFKVTPDGVLTTLHYFSGYFGGTQDGAFPRDGLFQASDGKFYGTTSWGGSPNPNCATPGSCSSPPRGVLYRMDDQPELADAPSGLEAQGSTYQATLNWTISAGANSYLVYERINGIRTHFIGAFAAPPITVNGLQNGTAYDFYVLGNESSCDSAHCQATVSPTSGPSNIVSVTPVAFPTGLGAVAGDGQVQLTWDSATGATTYDVFQGTAPGDESATPVQTGITGTNATINGLTNGVAYYFVVKAVNPTATSWASSEVSATPQPPPDTTPDAFSFADQLAVPRNSVRTSNAIAVSGIDSAAAISVTGGEYSIDGGGFVATAGMVSNGQSVQVRHASAAEFSSTTTTTLAIGGVAGTFTSTTEAQDTVPNVFAFTDQSGVNPGATITSDAITVSGINDATPISVAGGSYNINGGGFTEAAATVNSGDTVRVQHTSSSSFSTAANTTLTIGGVSDTFTSTTVAQDATPNAFSFTDQTSAALNAAITSNAITVSGINSPASISISGGMYSIGNGAYTAATGTVSNGQSVRVQVTSSSSNSTAVTATLTIGGVSDEFSVTTVAAVSGGGGGGALSWPLLTGLAGLAMFRSRRLSQERRRAEGPIRRESA